VLASKNHNTSKFKASQHNKSDCSPFATSSQAVT
jgi:hypothetical protein